MTTKLVLLKSGEDIIADVTEMVVGEEDERRIVGYFFDKPCIIKLREGEEIQDQKSAYKISMFPWMPLSEDPKIPVPADWVVTMVEPKEQLRTMYLEDVVGNGKDSEDSSTHDTSDSD
tara:strand:+ start:892 stop:1245 length:354 start_codon:yes stop_codon:yes gene_type:complete